MRDITLLVRVGAIIFVVVYILLVLAWKELYTIKKYKKCKHICFLCEYKEECHK